jgi:hypothetical protein
MRMTHHAIVSRISDLRFQQRRRTLTPSEAAELENLEYRYELRIRRLTDQIAACRAKLERLCAIRDGSAAA